VSLINYKVLVYEPFSSGHRLKYASLVYDALRQQGFSPIFGTSMECTQSREFFEFFGNVEGLQILTGTLPAFAKRLDVNLANALLLSNLLTRSKPDRVYIPTADGVAQWFGWLRMVLPSRSLRPSSMEILLMRGHDSLKTDSRLRTRLRRLWLRTGLKNCGATVVHALDDQIAEIIHAVFNDGVYVSRIPEMSTQRSMRSREQARRFLGLQSVSGPLIGFLGLQSKRKGFDLLLRTFMATLDKQNGELLLAGRRDRETESELIKCLSNPEAAARIHCIDGFLSEDTLGASLDAADIVAIPYPSHSGSSGMLVDAAAANKMVLASNFGWIGKMTRDYGLGITCDVNDGPAFGEAFIQAITQRETGVHSDKRASFVRRNTKENFQRAWVESIERELIARNSNRDETVTVH
jgi:glycosyltransferase involved in cell wall biosynthesis